MQLLLSNDDGIFAPGITILAEHLKKTADVKVITSFYERSSTGHSITFHKPIRVEEIKSNFFATSGTPSDAVYIGLRLVFKNKTPDLLISGINRGPNLGYDIYYSGTVAAAREACLYGVPSISVSLAYMANKVKRYYYESAAKLISLLIKPLLKIKFSKGIFYNINVPNLPLKKIKGLRFAKLGKMRYKNSLLRQKDPRGKSYYWLGGIYGGFYDNPGSDCNLINEGFATITPIKLDVAAEVTNKKLLNLEKLEF